MFMRLIPFAGPKRYVFKDPDTGFKFRAANKKDLIKHIVAYRAQNELEPIDRLTDVLENYWCSLPENTGACEPNRHIPRSMHQYVKGGVGLLMNLFYGEKNIVPQEEADRRADVCLGCPYNKFPDKNAFERWADDLAQKSVGDHRSKHHEQLGNCEVCSCNMRAKVFFGGKIELTEEELEKMEEVNCWQGEFTRKGYKK